jgi:hypothetical protein
MGILGWYLWFVDGYSIVDRNSITVVDYCVSSRTWVAPQ